MIEPIGDTHSALWIYKQLGERLGLSDYFQYTDEVDYINQQLAPLGVTVNDIQMQGLLRSAGLEGNRRLTSSSSTRPAARSRSLLKRCAKRGSPPCPRGRNRSRPPADKFYLLTGKVGQHTQIRHAEQPVAASGLSGETRLWIHPQDGRRAGHCNGDHGEGDERCRASADCARP